MDIKNEPKSPSARRRAPRAIAASTAMLMVATILSYVQLEVRGRTDQAHAATPAPLGRIIFDSDRATGLAGNDRNIFAMNADGSGEQTALTGQEDAGDVDPSFSPDGSLVAFASCRSSTLPEDINCELLESDLRGLSDSNIFVFNPAVESTSNPVRQLTTLAVDDGQPDIFGRALLYTSFRSGSLDIWKIPDVDSSNESAHINLSAAIPGGAATSESNATWSADGQKIAFSRDRAIWTMNANGTNPAPLTTPPGAATVEGDRDPAWSPDGKFIAFVRGNDIFKIDATEGLEALGNPAIPLTDVAPPEPFLSLASVVNKNPEWSPDGSKIVFASNGIGGDFDLYIMGKDGAIAGTVDTLTANDDNDQAPNWVENFTFKADLASAKASPSAVPVRHFPLQANTQAPDLRSAPLDVGIAPLDVGIAPLDVGIAPLDVGIAPLDVGIAPLDVGIAPPLNADALAALGDILLSSLPLRPGTSWEQILAGSALSGQPLQSVSYKDVLDLIRIGTDPVASSVRTRLAALDIGDVDFSVSRLGRLNALAIGLGLVPLKAIRVPEAPAGPRPAGQSSAQYWCAGVEAAGHPACGDALAPGTENALDLSLLELQLQGVSIQAFPVQAFPLGDDPSTSAEEGIDLVFGPGAQDKAALLKAKLSRINLGGVIGGITLGGLSSGRRNVVVDCNIADCADSSTMTLHEAGLLGAVRSGATFGDLGPSELPVARLHLGEVVYSLIHPSDNPALDVAPLDNVRGYFGAGNALVDYSLFFAPVVDQVDEVKISLPPTFTHIQSKSVSPGLRLVKGSSVTQVPGSPRITRSASEMLLAWKLDSSVEPGTLIRLDFKANPGFKLTGPKTSSAYILNDGAEIEALVNRNPVSVRENFTNTSPTGSIPEVKNDIAYLSHISGPGNMDYFKMKAPAPGQVLSIYLSHVPQGADYDLVVYGPTNAVTEAPLRPTGPAASFAPVEDPGFPQVGEEAAPQTLQDVPVVSGIGAVNAISSNRLDENESVRIVAPSVSGTSGFFTIQVSGYNGSWNPLPYMLRIRTTDMFDLPGSCRGNLPAGEAVGDWADSPIAPQLIPATAKTLVLVNRDRMFDLWGPAASQVLSSITDAPTGSLTSFLTHPKVNGALVAVDQNAAVKAAYDDWDRNACVPEKPNDVGRAINSFVDSLLPPAHQIKNIVIVGPDPIIPFTRLRDRTQQGNERAYLGDLAFTGKNAISSAFSKSFVLSDNPYADLGSPMPWLGGHLYIPDAAIGRLVETPAQIQNQFKLFMTANGNLDPQTSFVAGADFMKDGAKKMDTTLEAGLGTSQPDLISDLWNRADLKSNFTNKAAPPAAVSLNAHSSHFQVLPPAATSSAGLFTTADVTSGNDLTGRIIWSMGCHSGLNITDSLSTDALKTLDWAQASAQKNAAVYVAQTGYGLGSKASVALTERLNELFTRSIAQPPQAAGAPKGVGWALTTAKRKYAAQIGVYGVFDEKVIHEAVFFGIPVFEDPTPSATPPAADPAPLAVTTDPSTGLPAAQWSVTPSFSNPPIHDSHGDYFTADGNQPCLVHYRPLTACTGNINVSQSGGGVAWPVVTGATSVDIRNFNPVIADPLQSAALQNLSEPHFEGTHPSNPVQVNRVGDEQWLVANVGQFRGNEKIGTQRNFLQMSGKVYSLNSDGLPRPLIKTSKVEISGSNVTFIIEATSKDGSGQDNMILGSILMLDDSGTGVWRYIDLVRQGTSDVWKATTAFNGPGLEYWVQFLGGGGSAFSAGKGVAHTLVPVTKGIGYKFAGPRPPDTTINSGATVPVKFNVYRGEFLMTNPSVVKSMRSYKSTSDGEFLGDAKPESTAGIVFDGTQMKYQWVTQKSWGKTFRVFEITLEDDSVFKVIYQIT